MEEWSAECALSEASPLDLELDVTAASPSTIFMVLVKMP